VKPVPPFDVRSFEKLIDAKLQVARVLPRGDLSKIFPAGHVDKESNRAAACHLENPGANARIDCNV
jgi:hypothetical protein